MVGCSFQSKGSFNRSSNVYIRNLVEDDVLKVFIMSEQLRVSFEDDGIAQIQMINGENRLQTPTVKEWNAALDKIVA